MPPQIVGDGESRPIFDLMLRNAALRDGRQVDIGIVKDRIAAVGPCLTGEANQLLQLEGRVVLPGLVEAHTHLDKALTIAQVENRTGTLYEAIECMAAVQHTSTVAEIRRRALRAAELFLVAGTTTLRTHVDLSPHGGLKAVEALLDVRQSLRGRMDIQLVALCCNYIGPDSATMRELAEESLRMGVDAIGGAPVLDGDACAHIDFVFQLAQRYNKHVDLHVDESDNPADFCLPYLAEITRNNGYAGRVMAGHCCSLAAVSDRDADETIEKVHAAGITVAALPSANMYLQGRGDRGMIRRGITRVGELLRAGVPVACGSDNVQDPFNPFGRGDLLLVANLFAHASHLGSSDQQAQAIDAITVTPAQALGLTQYGLEPGCMADLVVLDTREAQTFLALVPPRRYVIKEGRIVAETRTEIRITDSQNSAASL